MTSFLHSSNFTSVLEAEKSTLGKFIEILKEEEDALVQGKIEEIDYLSSNKSRLIEKLIQIDGHRNEYLKNQGLALEKSSISNWLEKQLLNQPGIQTLWNELLALAQIAQKINHSNGLIISTHLQNNQRAFAALHCAAGNVSLYGSKGQTYI
ncbi:flagella synthesis protein FlgN [Nitrosomonas sp. Nm84]|uniref:flagella synthesis protein FlgN n=1 Tax=Nitrosomonas sp. Nm84 TaxID=200124 RepID=UPI000D76B9A6|nr:flagellar protein FlgN [Nitrosomonas sp. Nm84]PXW91357.1 flagella synthesis protein FlgN [Nitrosomonas sp. Nm84]